MCKSVHVCECLCVKLSNDMNDYKLLVLCRLKRKMWNSLLEELTEKKNERKCVKLLKRRGKEGENSK